MSPSQSASFVELRDALDQAIFDAYAGGALGEGWVFIGELISKDEIKVRTLEDPMRMRHVNKITAAVWTVVEERVGDA